MNQTVVTNTAGVALTTQDFDFDWKVGPSFVLGYRPTPKDAWELTYFGLQDFDENKPLVSQTSDLSLPGDLGALAGLHFSGADAMDVTYTSIIQDAEVNYFWFPGSQRVLTFMTGFRYFRMDERFDISSTVTGVGTSDYDIHSVNNLYGWQLGTRIQEHYYRFGYQITGKAGAYGNNIDMRQLAGNVGEAPIRNAGSDEGHWAFIGQVDATISYRICKNWSALAGYEALWIDGVALAPDQLDFTNNPNSGTTLNHDGNVFMHGGHVGIACRW